MNDLLRALLEEAQDVAVVCRQLKTFSEPLIEELRSEVDFQAASIIKIGIMNCLLEGAQRHLWCLDETTAAIPAEEVVGGAGVLHELNRGHRFSLRELCRLMMVVSDNTASNALVRQIGMGNLNEFFSTHGYQASMQRFFMSPVVNARDNRMTALSAAQMLRDIYCESYLSPENREFAQGCLRRQQYREKLPLHLDERVVVGHKTGELDGVRHDAAVVESKEPYCLVVFTARGPVSWKVDKAMADFSLSVYEGLNP